MKKLNNKGYMLVEIILAFGIMMTLLYFITELTIKQKNKNDDLLVKTLVSTDQAIIYNTITDDLNKVDSISCDDIKSKISIDKEKNIITYDGKANVISEYATIGDFECNDNKGSFVELNIPINVKQLPNDSFDVNIKKKSSVLPEDEIILTTIRKPNDNNHTFFFNGAGSSHGWVGHYLQGPGTYNYVARYEFTTTSNQQAKRVKVIINPYVLYSGGSNNLRFYINRESESHKDADTNSPYHGALKYSSIDPLEFDVDLIDVDIQLTGYGDVEIIPNTKYYLWIFSSLKNTSRCKVPKYWDCTDGGYYVFDQGDFDAYVKIKLNPR